MAFRPDTTQINIGLGFRPDEASEVAHLFWRAFRDKLGLTLGPDKQAIAFLSSVLCARFAICARLPDERLVGVAGFKTSEGGLLGGGLRDLAGVYGWFGALWRGILLNFLERRLDPGILLMDGIFVHEDARGLGVGTTLLAAVKSHARVVGARSVRLDVIDRNPRAKALYLREGFEPIGEQRLGLLSHVFGFQSATEMIWTDPDAAKDPSDL